MNEKGQQPAAVNAGEPAANASASASASAAGVFGVAVEPAPGAADEPASTELAAEAGPLDAKGLVLKRLLAAHETWFDVSRDYAYAGRVFPGYAEFHSSAERYVLVKRAKLWEVNAHEYLFFELADHLTVSALEELVAFMTTEALGKVQTNPEHMTSYLSLVVIADAVEEGVCRAVKKARFRKNFKFGLEGWADLRLAVIDLSHASILTNAMGKELRASLKANAFNGA